MALRRALLEALAVEDRTRDAEARAAAAEQRAAAAEQRAVAAEQRATDADQRARDADRRLTWRRMSDHVGRQILQGTIKQIVDGHVEGAIRGVSDVADNYLSHEEDDDDSRTLEMIISGIIPEERVSVRTYWHVHVLKKILEARHGIPFDQQCLTLNGNEMRSGFVLRDYRLINPDDVDMPPHVVLSLSGTVSAS